VKRSQRKGQRKANLHRTTKETDIRLSVNLDGQGKADISTGIRFFDHMLEQIARHGGLDLQIAARGDLDVDQHHTVEDVGAAANVHLRFVYGRSSHHQVEVLFKSFARALRFAITRDRQLQGVLPSTKGLL
jgi:imidazoleglycerol phosphate dehydratase HisB